MCGRRSAASLPLQVFNGVRLSDRLKLLHAEGVSDGAQLVMLRKRPQAPQPSTQPPPRPTLATIEAAIRREAERQGVEVRAPTPAARPRAHRFEARLQHIMQVRPCIQHVFCVTILRLPTQLHTVSVL
jgi:hypothetical protein